MLRARNTHSRLMVTLIMGTCGQYGIAQYSMPVSIVPRYSGCQMSAVGDLDSEGSIDIVLAFDKEVVWYKGSQGWSIPHLIEDSIPGLGKDLLMLDLDQDQDSDIVVRSNSEVWLFENSGSGVFNISALFPTVLSAPQSCVAGDRDDDGTPDLLVSDWPSGTLFVIEHAGAGVYALDTLDWLGPAFIDMDLVDLDHDGLSEIMGWPTWSTITASVKDTTGSWTFGALDTLIDVGMSARYFNADMDSDGLDEILVSTDLSTSGQFSYHQDSAGWFAALPDTLPVSGWGWRIAQVDDIDADGDKDIYVLRTNPDYMELLLNDGNGAYAIFETSFLYEWVPHLLMTDITGDGWSDLVLTTGSASSCMFREDTLFTSVPAHGCTLDPFSEIYVCAAAAVMQSGEAASLLIGSAGNASLALLRSDASREFIIDTVITSQAQWPKNPAFGDTDGDGDPDLAVEHYNGAGSRAVYHYRNLDGHFGSYTIDTVATGSVGQPSLADLDLDGDVDLAFWRSAGILTALNDGSGEFVEADTTPFVSGYHWQCCMDLGMSAEPDRVGLEVYDLDGQVLRIFYNEGSPLFFGTSVYAIDTLYNGAGIGPVADLDQDGSNDLLAVHQDGILWYENLGGGAFASPVVLHEEPEGITRLAVGDIDLDGDVDIATLHGENLIDYEVAVTWLENPGDPLDTWIEHGVSTPLTGLHIHPPGINDVLFMLADLDGDSRLDIIHNCDDFPQVHWNNINVGFGPDFAPRTMRLRVVPNPATNELELYGPDPNGAVVHVFNALGAGVEPVVWAGSSGNIRLGVEALSAGGYCVRVIDREGVWSGRLQIVR